MKWPFLRLHDRRCHTCLIVWLPTSRLPVQVLHNDYTKLSGQGTFDWAAPELILMKDCTEKVHTESL
jgi:hypothetical protein